MKLPKKLTPDNQKKIFWNNSTYANADLILYGIPYDQTASYRKGTTKAFQSIRNEAEAIELYSPKLDKSLSEIKICDSGDLKIEKLKPEVAHEKIYEYTKKLINDEKFFIGIGGEHSVSHATIRALAEKYNDLHVIHFDAHTDLRDEFQGHKLSHANIIKRSYDILGPGRIFSFGIRSGSKEEFDFYKNNLIYCEQDSIDTLPEIIEKISNKPIFITIDVDVLDPSIMPGTGTVEGGGVTFKELLKAIHELKNLSNIVGADLVELSPDWDYSLLSTSIAIKLLRELILTIVKPK